MSSEEKMRCPSCGGADIRHSLRRGMLDSVMTVFSKQPFRCRRCERRFYRRVAVPEPVDVEAETPAADREQ